MPRNRKEDLRPIGTEFVAEPSADFVFAGATTNVPTIGVMLKGRIVEHKLLARYQVVGHQLTIPFQGASEEDWVWREVLEPVEWWAE